MKPSRKGYFSRGAVSVTAALLLGTSAGLHIAPAAAQTGKAAAASTVKPPKLDYKVNYLKNGLKVITLEDHRAPIATVQVWYRVGSKEEPKGQGGFAHLFEHLMFKGSKNVAPEDHARFVEQLGASYNANTFFDRTTYYETVPISAFDRALFLEADRMASLIVDEKNLASERDVVKEEYRLRVANAPYGSLLPEVLKLVYPENHPYSRPTIGSIPDLDAAKLADVKAFHATYYRPDNATLVLVGDFKTADALKKVEQYFGAIPKSPTGKFPRLPVPPDTQNAEKRITLYDKMAPLPLIGMAFRLPVIEDPDTLVFDVIAQILSAGQSSRLYRSLVREKQVAAQAGGEKLELQLGGVFFFFAVSPPGKDPAQLEKALQEEVVRLQTTEVTAEELTKARNQVLNAAVFGLISAEEKGTVIGETDIRYGKPDPVNEQIEKLQKVTAADVQRVAKKYFAPTKRNVFYMLPAAMQPAEKKENK
jgi:zinc protease